MKRGRIIALSVVALVTLALSALVYSVFFSHTKEALLAFNRIRVLPAGVEFRFEEDVVLKFVGKKATLIHLPKLVSSEYTMQLAENTHWWNGDGSRIAVRFHPTLRSSSEYSLIILAPKGNLSVTSLPFLNIESVSFIWRSEDLRDVRRYESSYPYPVVRFVTLPDVKVPFIQHGCVGWRSCIRVGDHEFRFDLEINIRVIEFKS